MKRWVIVVFVLLGALGVAFIHPYFALSAIALFLLIFFLARNLNFGLLILVFFFPYLGLVIDFSTFQAFHEVPYLKNINAPFVDLFGLVFLVAWGLSMLSSRGRRPWRSLGDCFASLAMTFPHGRSYFLFWFSGFVSLLKVPALHFAASLKYFARPFTFFYLVFFAMPVSIMTPAHNPTHPPLNLRGGERRGYLYSVLMVFFCTGLFSAIDGFLGLLFASHPDFPRARPVGLFGVSPLGPNHNLLAETLIATAPAGLVLSWSMKHETWSKNWIVWGMFFQWAVALLAFSRTAWIAVAVQTVLFLWLEKRKMGEMVKKVKKVIPGVLLILLVFLALSTFSETVRGSTLSRLDQARIAWFYFTRTPILGQGMGTFIPNLWQTRAFLLEYGEPIDAHGILFKLAFEQGLFGIVAFLIFAGGVIYVIWRTLQRSAGQMRRAALAALLIAVGSLTYQLFNTTYYSSKLWIPMAIAVALARSGKSGESGNASESSV